MKIFLSAFFFLLFSCVIVQANNGLKIVSLAPNLTKSIIQVGAADNLVGCTNYCNIQNAPKAQVVANAIQVYIEKVVALKPNLVLTAGLTDPETIKQLQKFGIKVVVVHSATSFDELCTQFLMVGELVGKKNEAAKIVADSKAKLVNLQNKIDTSFKRKIFFQIGTNPLFTVLPNTFMNDFITMANAENIANKMKTGTIGREFVIASNPDVIIITSMGIVGKEEKTTWESYKQLKAVKSGQIFIVDADKACSPTPIDFVETFEEIIRNLKPAAK